MWLVECCSGGVSAAAGAAWPTGGGTAMPIACIRARCVAACVFAQGKAGPGAKYWTSSCMYLPDGSVMPAYSTWQPVDGSIQPSANADQTPRRVPLCRERDPTRED